MTQNTDNMFESKINEAANSPDERFIDIHCHLLPQIDDGPQTMDDCLNLCNALVRDRIGTCLATPHQLGRYDTENSPDKIRQKVLQLNEALANQDIPLTVFAGADIRIDERIPILAKNGQLLTLADRGKYLLLELPDNVLIDIRPLIDELGRLSIKAIISHPERNNVLAMQPQVLLNWLNNSSCLQLTAGSLLGKFGTTAQKTAWQLLNSSVPIVIATDSHNTTSRSPCMRAAFETIRTNLGDSIAHLVCIDNPLRILNGEDLLVPEQINLGGGKYEQRLHKFRQTVSSRYRR